VKHFQCDNLSPVSWVETPVRILCVAAEEGFKSCIVHSEQDQQYPIHFSDGKGLVLADQQAAAPAKEASGILCEATGCPPDGREHRAAREPAMAKFFCPYLRLDVLV
jgi:hypothetical protein